MLQTVMKMSDAMQARNLTDADLARELSVTRSTVTRIRNGTRVPSLPLAHRIIEFFDGEVAIADLAGEDK